MILKWVNIFYLILFKISIGLNLICRGIEDDRCRAPGLGAGKSGDNKIFIGI